MAHRHFHAHGMYVYDFNFVWALIQHLDACEKTKTLDFPETLERLPLPQLCDKAFFFL